MLMHFAINISEKFIPQNWNQKGAINVIIWFSRGIVVVDNKFTKIR